MPEVYEFSAIAGLEIFDQLGGAPLDSGATFTMPFSRVCIEVTDDDPVMSGAVGGVPVDTTHQTAEVLAGGPAQNTGVYFHRGLLVSDEFGNFYLLAEVGTTGGDTYFTFVEGTPPVGATLTVITPIGIDEIGYHGLSAGQKWVPDDEGKLVIEAEDMDLSGYDPENNTNASGGEVVRVTGATEATASLVFGGADGTYDLELAYIDENDGQGSIEVLINGAVVHTVTLDADNGGDGETSSIISTIVIPDLELAEGDIVALRGTSDNKESARIDSISFCPHTAPIAQDDVASIGESGTAVLDILGNDTDPNGDPLTIIDADGNPVDLPFTAISADGREANVLVGATGALNFAADTAGNFEDLAIGETDVISVSYTVSDGSGLTDTATITVTVNGENDDPVAVDDSFTMTESGIYANNLMANDTDVDSSDLVQIISANGNTIDPSLGGATLFNIFSADGRQAEVVVSENFGTNVAVNPGEAFQDLALGETDTITFSYEITDNNGGTDTADVTVTITGENDGPNANDDTFRVDEGQLLGGSLLANDTDPDASDVLSIVEAGGNAINPLTGASFEVTSAGGRAGNMFIGPSGLLDIAFDQNGGFDDLAAGETDTVTLSYTITDGNGETDTATATITIDGENTAPVANDDTFRVDEGQLLGGSLLANDTDAETPGALSIVEAGGNAINPLTGASFEVTSAGGRAGNMFIGPSGLLDIAFDQNGGFDDLAAGETDTVTLSYTITDGNGETDTATATITIDGENTAPVANDDTFRVDEGQLLGGSLLANDTDAETPGALFIVEAGGNVINPLTGASFEVTSAGGRAGNMFIGPSGLLDIAFDQNGGFDDLAAGETDTVTLSYTITDGNGETDTATATITIDGENTAPVANDDTFRVDEGQLLGGSLLANDTDAETPGALSIVEAGGNVINPLTGASFEVTSAGGRAGNMFIGPSGLLDIAFDQNGGFDDLAAGETDTVTLSYTITDGNGETDTATATITIDGENAAPSANDDTFRVNEGQLLGGSLLANDGDADTADILSILEAGGNVINHVTGIAIFDITSAGGRTGNMFIAQSGALDMAFDQVGAFDDLAEGETDTVSFTYTITDGNGETDTATATITVDGQNDDPAANDDNFTVQEGVLLGQSLMGNDTDVDSTDGLTIISADGNIVDPISGIVVFDVISEGGRTGNMFIAASGGLDMAFDQDGGFDDMAEGETDIVSFSYTVSDGSGGTDTATATITVLGDGPATVTSSFSANTPNTGDAVSIELTTDSTTDDGLVAGDIEINFVSLPDTAVFDADIIVFDDSETFGTIVDSIEFDVPGDIDDPVNPNLVINGSTATASFQLSGLASDLGDANRAALVVQFDDDNDGIVDLPLFVEVDIFGNG